MTYYPVLIPTLNRYQHFKECVESLAACTHADKTELVIGLDYPPAEKYVEGWKKIKEYIPTIIGFAKITVFEHSYNLGARSNMLFLCDYGFEHYDATIRSEDDNIFSPSFLDYMNKCLDKYKDDKSIFAISGYMQPVRWSDQLKTDSNVIHIQEYMAYGIANWKDRFEQRNQLVPKNYLKYICANKTRLYKLRHKSLRDLYQLIFWIKNKPELDCPNDFTIACALKINNLCVISPNLSLVKNNGFDGSGENCSYDEIKYERYSLQEISKEKEFNIKDKMSNQELKQYVKSFENYINSEYGNNFTKRAKKQVLWLYYLYMIFGYNLGEKINDLLIRFWRFIYNLIQKFKKYYICI